MLLQDFSKGISLTKEDEEDLCAIIKKVLPDAPNFKVILESQLKNCQKKEKKLRRWSTQMISLCLHLWAT